MEKKKQILQRIQDNVLEFAEEDSKGKEFLTDEGFHSLTSTIVQILTGVICLQAIISRMDREKFAVMVDRMTLTLKKMCHSYYIKKMSEGEGGGNGKDL